jgi:hypothetical protein
MLRKVRSDVQRMVTVDYLEKEVLKGKDLEDLEESELKELQKRYLVVTVPADFEPSAEEGVELNDENIEEQKVEASPEFEAATEIYNKTVSGVASSIFFGTIFLILLTRKLDDRMDGSWWVVFVPVFLERGLKWLLNLYRCACGRMIGDEIVVHLTDPTSADDEGEADEKAKDSPEERLDSNKTSEKMTEGKDNSDDKTLTSQSAEETVPSTKEAEPTEESSEDVDKNFEEGPKSSAEKPESSTTAEGKDDDNIHIDEETFRAWQNAYAEAEESAMQEQAKASSECLNISLQLILLCLIVAKVEQSYESEDPDDVGFSTFWILFPFFLFFGIICCCCTLLIYGAAPGSAEDLNAAVGEENDAVDPEDPSNTNNAPIVVPPSVIEEKKDEPDSKADGEKDGEDGVEIEASNEEVTKSSGDDAMDDLD